MATITKNGLFDAIRKKVNNDWESWIYENPPRTETYYEDTVNAIAYKVFVRESLPITAASLNVSIYKLWSDITSYTIKAGIYQSDPTTGGTVLRTQTFTASGNETHEFSFSSLGIGETLPYHELYFLLEITDCQSSDEHLLDDPPLSFKANAAVFSLTVPALSVGVTPSELYAGNKITADFTNRIGETLTVRVFYNTTMLYETTATRDSIAINCPESWFDVAGVTGNSMGLKLRASDGYGRTSNDAGFTLKRATGGAISPISPRSTTLDGTASINFAWTYSGDGTLTKTELQWSRDNAEWTNLATISGNGTSWTASAISFPAGTIYWRARATNSFGLVGAWSSGVSFTVKYAAQSQAVPVNSPTGGIISAAQAQTFQVALEASAPVYEPFTISAATFYWRAGESGDYTAVTMTPNGNSASVTIPAETFPSGGIQWYATATDNTGRTTQTSVFSLSTLNAAVEAVPIAPNNTVESSDAEILFRWRYASLDGSASAGAELQKSADGIDWSDLVSVPAGVESVPVSGAGFAAGKVFWRVRAQNAAGDWSDWSTALSFQVFGAPVISSVSSDGKPFLTVSWQVEGQMAYQIEVDGKTYGPYFGADVRSYTLPEPLADGTYTARVRAQNQYSLWSEWVSGNISVTNVPGPEITVAEGTGSLNIGVNYFNATLPPEIVKTLPERVVQNSGSFRLICQTANTRVSYQWQQRAPGEETWSDISGATRAIRSFAATSASNGYEYRCKVYTALGEVYTNATTFTYGSPDYMSDIFDTDIYPETGYFLIYRDDILIGTTRRNYFTDRTALGAHEYYVLQVLPGGYYTKSNTVTLTSFVDCPMIALLEGGNFIQLALSDTFAQDIKITRKRSTQKTYYSGSKFPSVDIGEHEEYSASLATFWIDEDSEDADTLEAMLGEEVILKLPKGRVLVGVLDTLPIIDSAWRRVYTVTLGQDDWSDFVDDT